MIIGLGLDVVELDRMQRAIDKWGERFARRILTPREFDFMPPLSAHNCSAFLASRFAAKEAASKALGTGFSQGVGLKTLEVCSPDSGKPEMVFYGQALALCRSLGVNKIHVSLTHGRDVAAAVVILEKQL